MKWRMYTMFGVAGLGACAAWAVLCADKQKEKIQTPFHQESNTMTIQRHTTPSGLAYEILHPGNGKSPQSGKLVTVHYTGWLDANGAPGQKFDSSIDRGTPFSFTIGIGQVIRGWDEGVLSMRVGEKRRLYIPAALGYGERGAGKSIPPRANLIFDVELIAAH